MARSEQPGTLPGTIGSVAAEITETGGRALPVTCDVTSEASMNDVVAATISEFIGIDVLVANAGMRWLGPVETTPLKRWQLCLDVNLTGVFLVIRAVIPHIRARGGGSLIAITTTGVDMPGANAYWVSKAAGTLPACRFHPRWWNHRRPWRRPRWCWPVKTLRRSQAPCSVPKNSTPEATARLCDQAVDDPVEISGAERYVFREIGIVE